MLFVVPLRVSNSIGATLMWGIRYSVAFALGNSGSYFETLKNYINSVSNKDYFQIKKPYIENFGSYEKEIFEAVNRGTYKNDTTNNVLQTIILNRRIRNVLKADFQFAIIGRKKLGKSTFLETIIPGANANASATTPFK
jgi:hypothetical protein